ncbi:hypothetical protein PR048_012482 [Dryococelus australis]|uniref:CCHC-type domain-containing protein n=1 Tax=Dryococelus australis TaxID=614101 RepID=A0ABQ9HPI8_9NEOP|nr:hypothetical protein PR048_012482 [Dryococelus australis]
MCLQERIKNEASTLTEKMNPKLYVSKKTVNTKGPKCFNCVKVGHIIKYCPKDSSRDKTKAYSSGSGNRNHRSKCKDEALLRALNLFRATLHMIPKKDWLMDLKDDSHIKMTVTNDESVLSEDVSNVKKKVIVLCSMRGCARYTLIILWLLQQKDEICMCWTYVKKVFTCPRDNQQTDCGMIGWDTSTEWIY